MPRSKSAEAEVQEQLAQAAAGLLTTEYRGDAGKLLSDLQSQMGVGGSMTSLGTTNPERDESFVKVYAVLDGAESDVLVRHLAKVLGKRLPNERWVPADMRGRPVFSVMPVKKPAKLELLCPLHPDSPNRADLDSMGLAGATCEKHNIPNVMEQEMHFMRKHPISYRVVEKTKHDREMTEYRTRENRMVEALLELGKKAVDKDNG